MTTRLFSFMGGNTGFWRVADMKVIVGEPLPAVRKLEIASGSESPSEPLAAWWALTHEERLGIFKEQSHHAQIGLRHFPTLARRLHHCRDLSENEPFVFLTLLEYEPAQEVAFNKLVAELRAIAEWKYVEREVDIRLVREEA